MTEQTLQQRLEAVLTMINRRADEQIAIAEDGSRAGPVRDNALSYALGARFARDIIQGEFIEFWPDEDEGVFNG